MADRPSPAEASSHPRPDARSQSSNASGSNHEAILDMTAEAGIESRSNSEKIAQSEIKSRSEPALSFVEEAFVVMLRKLTLASLEALLPHMQLILPKLSRSAAYRAWVKWGVSRAPTHMSPLMGPFVSRSLPVAPCREGFQIHIVEIDEPEKLWIILLMGEKSGWIYPSTFEQIDARLIVKHIKEALSYLAELHPDAAISYLVTPYHWAFCLEDSPSSGAHYFCKFCDAKGIKRVIATPEPVAIPKLQRGW